MPSHFVLAACLVTLLTRAHAQCTVAPLDHHGLPGINGTIYATTSWDPDGPGPAAPVLIVGGKFTVAGDTFAQNLAALNPVSGQWAEVGGGTDDAVRALAVAVNGDLIIGGDFTAVGSVAANGIARWSGMAWSPFAGGLLRQNPSFDIPGAHAIVALANGDVLVGGIFDTAGTTAAANIARWNGTSWFALGSGTNARVACIAVQNNGTILAGGDFQTAGSAPAARLAQWNGTSWGPLGSGVAFGSVFALHIQASGVVVAAGSFTTAGGMPAQRIAAWSGSSWSALGTGLNAPVRALHTARNGDLLAGGEFTQAGNAPALQVARWNGLAWATVGTGPWRRVSPSEPAAVRTFGAMPTLANGELFVGGSWNLENANGLQNITGPQNLARWNGSDWAVVGTGTNGYIFTQLALRNGDILVGGDFTSISGVAANRIARWDGASWHALGSGLSSWAEGLAELPNGDIVAAGEFRNAGGQPAAHIARWDGTTWHPLGSGCDQTVWDVVTLPNGDLIAGGNFVTAGGLTCNSIARWDGAAWHSMGSGANASVLALTVLQNGDLIVGGGFSTLSGSTGSYLARWDGTVWSGFPSTTNSSVRALHQLANGDLIVGGGFTYAGGLPSPGIARWDGQSWHAMGQGLDFVRTITSVTSSDVVAGGWFAIPPNTPSTTGIARWNGTSWSRFGGPTDNAVYSVLATPADEVFAGGVFTCAGQIPAPFHARLATSCPATAVPFGSSCLGSNGPLTLSTQYRPWLGSTFTATVSGLSTSGIVFGVVGLLPQATPLAQLHPAGAPGCSLLTSPDAVVFLVPASGGASWALSLPTDPGLVGVTLLQQVLEVELGVGSGILAIRSSNGLSLTTGSF